MNRFLTTLSQEWEKALLWASIALLVLLAAGWLGGFGDQGRKGVALAAAQPQQSMLNDKTAYAFLTLEEPAPLPVPHPFSCNLDKRVRSRFRGNQKNETKPSPKTAPPPPKKPPKPEPKPAPPPPKKKVFLTVGYLGAMTTASGQTVALLETVDSGQRQFLKPGDRLGGFQVETVTDAELTLKTDTGQSLTIPFGKRHKVEVP